MRPVPHLASQARKYFVKLDRGTAHPEAQDPTFEKSGWSLMNLVGKVERRVCRTRHAIFARAYRAVVSNFGSSVEFPDSSIFAWILP
jgi:hypothetical protein